jgi:hypothetical protein
MKYAVEISLGAMIYIPSFIKTGYSEAVWEGIHRHTDAKA